MYFLDLWGCLCCFRILHGFFQGRKFVTKERGPIQWSYCITPESMAFSPQKKKNNVLSTMNRILIGVIYFTSFVTGFLDPPCADLIFIYFVVVPISLRVLALSGL